MKISTGLSRREIYVLGPKTQTSVYMYDLSGVERRFAFLISSSHFTQHVYYRVLPPLIPVLAVALAYPLWQLGLLITFYSLGMGIVQAPFGVLSDRIDRRFLLPTGLGFAGMAYILFATAPAIGSVLPAVTLGGHTFQGGFLVMSLSMVFVGVGLAVVHPVGYPMITDNVDGSNKGKVLGMFGASSKLGDAAAPAIIAGLILILTWQEVVLFFGVAGTLYGIVLYRVLQSDQFETVPAVKRETEDETGEETTDEKSTSTETDRRSYAYPMIAVYCFAISSMVATRGLNTFLPAFVVVIYAYSFDIASVHVGAESIGSLYFSVLLVAGAGTQLVLGGMTDRHDARHILIGCMVIATVGLFALALLDLHPAILLGVIVVLGAGLYGINPARDSLISEFSPPEREGRTFGYLFTATSLTTAPLPALIGYVLEVGGMRGGFALLAIGPMIAGVCVLTLYSDRVYASKRTHVSQGSD